MYKNTAQFNLTGRLPQKYAATPFEHIRDQVIVTDAEGKVQYANKATEEATGFPLKEIVGKKAGKLWGGQMPKEFYEKMWHTIKVEKQPFVGTVKNTRKDGTAYYAELRIYPVLDAYGGTVLNFIGIEPDVTDRIEEEEKRGEFVSLATHQLKTPLTTEEMILGILDRSGKNLTNEQKDLIRQARELNRSLAECIRDLLILSRIEKGDKAAGREKISFASFLHTIIEETNRFAREKKVNVLLAYEEDTVLRAPENILHQIVMNLVVNAITYSKPHGDVLMAFRNEDEQALFMCRDHGIGIPEEEQGEIFQPFFRASNAKKEREGTGLGLYIVKKLADELGCRVWFESSSAPSSIGAEKQGGTIFYLSIPLTEHNE